MVIINAYPRRIPKKIRTASSLRLSRMSEEKEGNSTEAIIPNNFKCGQKWNWNRVASHLKSGLFREDSKACSLELSSFHKEALG